MKISDSMANFIAAKLDIPNTIKNWFPEYVPDGMVVCPYHDDKNASLHINAEGKALCHGCGWKAVNIIDLYAKMQEITYLEARKQLYDEVVDAIPASKYMTFWKRLIENPKALAYVEGRGVGSGTISDFHLGYDPHTKRITIPIIDQFGSCVNIRMMAFDRESKHKALNLKSHGEVRLYPEWLAVNENKLLLVEGEWDCLIGRQLRLPTVTWTGGANSWNKEYNRLFTDKNVMVLYDADDPGRVGGKHAYDTLLFHAANVFLLEMDGDRANGKDLNDWYLRSPSTIGKVEETFRKWDPEIKKHRGVCPACGREL